MAKRFVLICSNLKLLHQIEASFHNSSITLRLVVRMFSTDFCIHHTFVAALPAKNRLILIINGDTAFND